MFLVGDHFSLFFMMIGYVFFKVGTFEDELIISFYCGGEGFTYRVKPSDSYYVE